MNNKILQLIKEKKLLSSVIKHIDLLLLERVNPEKYLIKLGREFLGYDMDLKNPRTLNEKLNWYKINYKNSLMTTCVDKIAVDDYIFKKGLGSILLTKYKIWSSPKQINLDELPDSFAIKTNHDSGGVIVCKSKEDFTEKKRNKLIKAFRKNYSNHFYEWPYSKVHRKVFAEELIKTNNGHSPIDYKFYCSKGKVKFFLVCTERDINVKIDFIDLAGHNLMVERTHENSGNDCVITNEIKEMIRIAEVLSSDFPFVRVDLYCNNGEINFGELTFFPGGGMEKFTKYEDDLKLGNMLDFIE